MAKKKVSFRDKVRRAAEKAKNETTGFGYLDLPRGVPVFTPTPGARVFLDFMPYEVTDEKHPDRDDSMEMAVPGSLWYRRPFKTHRNVGSGNETVVCLSSFGKKCPVCEQRAKMIQDGNSKEETDALKPSRRVLYAVIPLKNKDYEEKVHIWDMSYYLFQNLLDDELNEDPDLGAFPDLEEGYTLKIRFDSDSFGGSKPFARASRIDFLERDEAYDEAILEDVPNLDNVLHELSYKELTRLLFDLDEDDIVDTKEEPEATSIKRKKKVIAKEEPEEEEPEPEKPVRRKKVIAKEEPEPEKPVRRKKVIAKEEQEEEEPEPEKPAKNKEEGYCPYGHTFGKDTDKYEECDTCEVWDLCIDAKES